MLNFSTENFIVVRLQKYKICLYYLTQHWPEVSWSLSFNAQFSVTFWNSLCNYDFYYSFELSVLALFELKSYKNPKKCNLSNRPFYLCHLTQIAWKLSSIWLDKNLSCWNKYFSSHFLDKEKMFEFEIKSPVGKISTKFLHRYQVRSLHIRRKIVIDFVTHDLLKKRFFWCFERSLIKQRNLLDRKLNVWMETSKCTIAA